MPASAHLQTLGQSRAHYRCGVEPPVVALRLFSQAVRFPLAVYLDDAHRQDFLKTLAEAWQKTAWQVHACRLMANHYHLGRNRPMRIWPGCP